MTADMKKVMGKRIGAGALVVLHLWSVAAYAAVCPSTSSLGSVFSVLKDGEITFGSANDTGGRCAIQMFGISQVNVDVTALGVVGSGVTGIKCKTYATVEAATDATSTPLTASGATITGPALDEFFESPATDELKFDGANTPTLGGGKVVFVAGVADIGGGRTITKSGSTFTLSGGDYGSIYFNNFEAANAISFAAPVRIKSLKSANCNGGSGVTFASDVLTATPVYRQKNFIDTLALGDGCSLSVAGRAVGSGRTTLNVLGKDPYDSNKIVGLRVAASNPCFNYPYADCTAIGNIDTSNNNKTALAAAWANMWQQMPDLLQINIYNGDFYSSDRSSIAAGIYVPNGSYSMNNASGTTLVGEVLAQNVTGSNNDKSLFFSKSTASEALKTSAYSLTPPVADAITDTGSYVYRAMQNDYRADGKTPGTSGHLKAFALKADSSQEQTPVWDAADPLKMTPAVRAAAIQTETDDWASSGVDFKVLDAAYGCVIDPRPTACRMITNDPRDPTSIMGVPWRVAPIIVGDSVLFATDDGVLYSVNKSTGALNWGWIPKEILDRTLEVDAAAKMVTKHSWGQIDSTKVVVTAADGTQTTHTYVLGTALGGQLHFALEVSNNGATLNKLLWRDYQANQFSPGSAVAGWAGVSGRPYGGAAPAVSITDTENKVAYVKGGKLFVRKIDGSDAPAGVSFVAGAEGTASTTTYVPTSNLLYVDDSSIYFGSSSGKVYQSNKSGVLANVADGVDKVALGADPVWYVNATQLTSATGNALMLLAQTQYRVNILKFAGDKWTFAWYTGLTAAGLGEASPTTQKIGTVAADKAYLSASADILNGSVILYYTTKPDACTINGYTFGPLKLEDGSALMDSEFRLKGIDSLSNLIGRGEATGGNFTVFKNKAGVLTGSAGDSLGVGDIGLISHAGKSGRQRLNWRELTNFF